MLPPDNYLPCPIDNRCVFDTVVVWRREQDINGRDGAEMTANKTTSVAAALVVASMQAGLLGDAWRTMTALQWARRVGT